MTEPSSRRRRSGERSGRWFPGLESLSPSGSGQGTGPDGDGAGLPGLGSPGGSTAAAQAMPAPTTPPDGLRGTSAGEAGGYGAVAGETSGYLAAAGPHAADVSNPRGAPARLPGVGAGSGRSGGAIDGLPPFEAGPYDGYDAYDPATDPSGPRGSDWATSPQTSPIGFADRAGTPGFPDPAGTPNGPARGKGNPAGPDRTNTPPGLAVGPPTGPKAPATGDLAEQLAALSRRLDEMAGLRRHDVELVDRLHEENTKLRQGELTEAMGPLLRGLIRLHDQMSSLGGDDPQSVAGILRKQLLQVLDISADVRPYIAVPGSQFDPTRHLALRGIGTDDPARDRTIARGVRPGFVRGTSTVLRPAEAEVYRHR